MTIARLNLAVSAVPKDGRLEDVRAFIGTLGTAALRCPPAEKALSQISPDRNDIYDPFCDALAVAAEEAIPGRSTLPYKRSAIRALGLDVCAALIEAARKEVSK
jgi:carbon-monoxide dehydrogenase medium subunit